MKMSQRKLISVVCIAFVLLFAASVPVSAASAYQTYTYSISGEMLYSPDAYTATLSADYAYMGLDVTDSSWNSQLSSPSDMVVDDEKNVYIVTRGSKTDEGCVVALDPYLKVRFVICEFINEQGLVDRFNRPQGMFVSKDYIWVCDTENQRIVVFDREGNFVKQLWKPESQLFRDDAGSTPIAIAVDKYNRVYVVSNSTSEGIIMMTEDGEFTGFVGAQATTMSTWEILMRRFQSSTQRENSDSKASTEYRNVSITEEGFIYATVDVKSDSDLEGEIENGMTSGSLTGVYSPVKLLNSKGTEIMKRNGFWPPAGEVDIDSLDASEKIGVSKLTDVAVGPERTWTTIDTKRNRTYTYDYNGNLLFAFGDNSAMLGGIGNVVAVVYQGNSMLILDGGNTNSITVYDRTEYGDLIIKALNAENNMEYDLAVECWKGVLQRNSNYDAAYVGIGNALYRDGRYKESLDYYEAAYDTENWSKSWTEVRRDWMSKYVLIFVAIIVAVIFAWAKFLKFAKKVNKAATVDGKARKTFGQECLYGFYVIFHPFDGFYDLKHEHRGSVRASFVFIGAAILTFFYQAVGVGYVMNPTREFSSLLTQALSVLVPLVLFMVANWCLTTLFDGEGSLKDIFIASSYSLLPIPILIIPATILSNFVTVTESSLITMFTVIAFIWLGILLFLGTMVTHDYSIGKNFLTIFATVVGMVCIMFLAILFVTLIGKLVSLVANIVTELQFRT